MFLDISTQGYIDRIKQRLSEASPESILYAALELRCAVEGRMKQYLEPLAHIPKKHKKEWSVVKLGRNINNAFKLADQIAVFTFSLQEPFEEVQLKYIPISKELQDIVNKLGSYLHYPVDDKPDSLAWIETAKKLVSEGLAWLEFAASGELIGLPLVNNKTGSANILAYFQGNDLRRHSLSRLAKGTRCKIDVSYLPIPKSI